MAVRCYGTVSLNVYLCCDWMDSVGRGTNCPLWLDHGAGGLVPPDLDNVNCRYVEDWID